MSESRIAVGRGKLQIAGDLIVPNPSRALVVFAHGSGSSRHSPRNKFVAAELSAAGFATLLADLLTADEEMVDRQTAALRFDVGLLAGRLADVVSWSMRQPEISRLPVGYFGASTGAASALIAAADRPVGVFAIVSRGGRPDLAGAALGRVRAPTLLIVGGDDPVVLDVNRQAMKQLQCEAKLETVPHATHLFEERGALEQVAALAEAWFISHLPHRSDFREQSIETRT